MTIRETLTRIRDDAQAALDALDSGPTAPELGPKGEWTPTWLTALNNAYRSKFPDGYTGQIVDPNARTRVPLTLTGAILWGNAPWPLSPEQEGEIHRWCSLIAWGVQAFTLIRNPDGIARITAVYREGIPSGPGEYTLALARGLWPTEAEVEAAVVDLYERTFGPL